MDFMPKNLVIVESPAKAKTIEQFLGKDYVVKSSFGHIRDLPKKGLNIDVDNDFAPKYEISQDKKKVVSELKKIAQTSDDVILASDEDREGEAIAWHLTQALKLDPLKAKRIVFHEITKPAIEEAIKSPRTVDLHLVDAQQARRVLDRIVGYELSPLLWKKVRTGLSAGRVQSVAVRLIVEREREIRNFTPESSFKISADFMHGNDRIPATLEKTIASYEQTRQWLEKTASAEFVVSGISTKPSRRSPSAPFTTSTLQQEASRRLGFSVRQTMTIAQRLYEAGLITYMRTDSTLLSGLALNAIGSYIESKFGANYHTQRQFKTKSQSAQEAHEAIRPTDVSQKSVNNGDIATQRLYELIWQRTVSSQMSDARISRSEIAITISNQTEKFIAKGEVLEFDGFMKVYGGAKEDVILPQLKNDDKLTLDNLNAREQFSRSPARYSEASLVRKLEELGIGRPSTYAPTISTIQTRGYVEKTDLEGKPRQIRVLVLRNNVLKDIEDEESTGNDRAKLIPTPIAEVTTDFLIKYFPSIVDYDFTAKAEEDFDAIALGKEPWNKMIAKFYKQFHPLIEKTNNVSRHEVSQARLVGKDPKNDQPIYARFGRYGPMLQRGETTEDSKPEFAPMPEGETIETVSLEQALVMFQLPRFVGKTSDGQEIIANIGRFGPYIKVGAKAISIKGYDPHSISEDEAIKLYEEKLKKDAEKNIKEFASGIKVLNGPYGPYITNGKKNARIAKDIDPASITEAQAKDLLDKAPDKKRRFRRKKSK